MATEKTKVVDVSKVTRGIVCFTFDDGVYGDWLACRKLFKKYNAHATFFYWGDLTDAAAIASMKVLLEDGHSVGAHTVAHLDAVPNMENMGVDKYVAEQLMPQIENCRRAGIDLHNLAYPNNRHNAFTDGALSKYFRKFRAGLPGSRPKGFWIANQDEAYTKLEDIKGSPVLGGCGIGEYYLSTQENLDAALERAAKENAMLVFFSHGISADAKGVNMPLATLEACLKKSSELGLLMLGFDELP